MTDPDLEWVERARQGDKQAFGKLVNHYYEMVYMVCYGVLRLREAARDTTQDVFLKAFQEIARFKGDSKFKTWLYRVAMNAAIDAARKRKPQVSLDGTDASDDEDQKPVVIEDTTEGPRDQASRGEIKVLMKQALEELSPEHKAVLVLREWEGLSYEEIGETLGVELGTVMSRIFYARKKMGEVLKKMGLNAQTTTRSREGRK